MATEKTNSTETATKAKREKGDPFAEIRTRILTLHNEVPNAFKILEDRDKYLKFHICGIRKKDEDLYYLATVEICNSNYLEVDENEGTNSKKKLSSSIIVDIRIVDDLSFAGAGRITKYFERNANVFKIIGSLLDPKRKYEPVLERLKKAYV